MDTRVREYDEVHSIMDTRIHEHDDELELSENLDIRKRKHDGYVSSNLADFSSINQGLAVS